MKAFAYSLIAISMALLCTINFNDEVSILFEIMVYSILISMLAVGGLIIKRIDNE